jgi:hypothetical protein
MRPVFTFLIGSTLVACAGGDTGRADASTTVTTAPPSTTDTTGTASDAATDPPTGTTASASDSATGSATDSATSNPTDATSVGPGTTTEPASSTGSTGPVVTTDTDTADTTDTGDESTTGVVPEKCPCPDDLEVPLDDGIFVLSEDRRAVEVPPLHQQVRDARRPKVTSAAVDLLDGRRPPGLRVGPVQRPADPQGQRHRRQRLQDPGFVPMQHGVENFGMAFVSNSAEDKCDRIYGNHYNGVAMGKDASEFFSVDPMTLDLVQLGKSDYGLAEVTGTGDGRAFLFAGPDPADLVEVDKNTGDTLATIPLPGVKTGGGFAFAFFAGDFYFFTDAESDSTSEVTHLDYDDSDKNGKQDLTVVLQDAPCGSSAPASRPAPRWSRSDASLRQRGRAEAQQRARLHLQHHRRLAGLDRLGRDDVAGGPVQHRPPLTAVGVHDPPAAQLALVGHEQPRLALRVDHRVLERRTREREAAAHRLTLERPVEASPVRIRQREPAPVVRALEPGRHAHRRRRAVADIRNHPLRVRDHRDEGVVVDLTDQHPVLEDRRLPRPVTADQHHEQRPTQQ